jgi:hypothetical protein
VSINKKKVSSLQKKHQTNQNVNHYTVYLSFYNEMGRSYVVPPNKYLSELETLRANKEDIFSKGKILTFTDIQNKNFYFDAVVEKTEEEEKAYYSYVVPIKKKYRYLQDLVGKYDVKERTGDLTYIRMKDALYEFLEGDSCSEMLESFILGNNVNTQKHRLYDLFNFKRYYIQKLRYFGNLSRYQISVIENIFKCELNTIKLSKNTNIKNICFIINAIFQRRRDRRDKILVCSSSNSVADTIALDLMNMNYYTNTMNLLRIYAKNQEIIDRNKNLDGVTYHKLIKKKNEFGEEEDTSKRSRGQMLIKYSDIIISTCVNGYTDEIINYDFPYVIIVDASNSSESECLIPITLRASHVLLISYGNDDDNDRDNLYSRMKKLYHWCHYTF